MQCPDCAAFRAKASPRRIRILRGDFEDSEELMEHLREFDHDDHHHDDHDHGHNGFKARVHRLHQAVELLHTAGLEELGRDVLHAGEEQLEKQRRNSGEVPRELLEQLERMQDEIHRLHRRPDELTENGHRGRERTEREHAEREMQEREMQEREMQEREMQERERAELRELEERERDRREE